jgi:hypothetical protein
MHHIKFVVVIIIIIIIIIITIRLSERCTACTKVHYFQSSNKPSTQLHTVFL